MNWRTPLAKAVYWIGGQLTRIKCYQHTYSIDPIRVDESDPDGIAWITLPREWHSFGFAFTVLDWSEAIDPKHWEHWVFVHDDCDPDAECPKCEWCGGTACYRDVEPGVTEDGRETY